MKKKYLIEKYGKNKKKWLGNRGIGGSSASAILGCNPWLSKLELYNMITNPKYEKKASNESMKYGVKLEPLIREIYRVDAFSKYKVNDPCGFEMYRRIDKPWMTATLDGTLIEKNTHKKGILEIKTHDVRNRNDLEEWNGKLPANYYIQVLHYLSVVNDAEFAVLVAKLNFYDYIGKCKQLIKSEIRYYYLDRKELIDEIEKLEKAETEFWENNVQKRVIPIIAIKF